MLFLTRTPAPPLDRWIASIWYCENDSSPLSLERVLPSGAGQLIVNLNEDQTRVYHPEPGPVRVALSSGTILSGVASRYTLIDTAEQHCVAGVAFRPGGTTAFSGVPADEMRDGNLPLDFLWGRGRTAELRQRLLEAASPAARLDVLEQAIAEAWRPPDLDPAVRFALRAFGERPEVVRVAAVADSAGLNARRFIEKFKTVVGLAPKHYCRILRFQRALARAETGRTVDWTRIAADSGYFDQPHFIRDFRAFAGITPTGYEAGRTGFRNHVKFVQSDLAVGGR